MGGGELSMVVEAVMMMMVIKMSVHLTATFCVPGTVVSA